MRIRQHHPLTQVNPAIPEDSRDFKRIKDSIIEIGIVDRITLYEGKILDGRTRYRIATQIGIKASKIKFTRFKGTEQQARDYVFAKNILRKQLSEKQIMVAAALKFYMEQPRLVDESIGVIQNLIASTYHINENRVYKSLAWMRQNPHKVKDGLDGVTGVVLYEGSNLQYIVKKAQLAEGYKQELDRLKSKTLAKRHNIYEKQEYSELKMKAYEANTTATIVTLENTLLRAANSGLAHKLAQKVNQQFVNSQKTGKLRDKPIHNLNTE
jgi:ParB-like chromosome segregation protein Spo0J